MSPYCALPPLDMSVARVGRGFGPGWNRLHTRMDQLHGGLDIIAASGSPIVAVAAGRVTQIGLDSNRPGRNGLNGYGNSVVVETTGDIPGMPNTFTTLYAHMRAVPLVTVGQRVQAGTPLGFVGNTTNGAFAGLGAHLHIEVRNRAFVGSSYDRNTMDPTILFNGLGIDRVGARMDGARSMGGQLLVRAGGPSDCRAGGASTLAGLERSFALGIIYGPTTSGQAGPGEQYIPPATLSPNYPGPTAPGVEVPDPPAYASESASGSSSSSSGALWLGAGALVLAALWKATR